MSSEGNPLTSTSTPGSSGPSRSRIVLRYSARVSRRMPTVPGSHTSPTLRSIRASSQATSRPRSASASGGSASGGGIVWARTRSVIRSSVGRSASAATAAFGPVGTSTSPLSAVVPAWHSPQCVASSRSASSAAAPAAGLVSRPRMRAETSRADNRGMADSDRKPMAHPAQTSRPGIPWFGIQASRYSGSPPSHPTAASSRPASRALAVARRRLAGSRSRGCPRHRSSRSS